MPRCLRTTVQLSSVREEADQTPDNKCIYIYTSAAELWLPTKFATCHHHIWSLNTTQHQQEICMFSFALFLCVAFPFNSSSSSFVMWTKKHLGYSKPSLMLQFAKTDVKSGLISKHDWSNLSFFYLKKMLFLQPIWSRSCETELGHCCLINFLNRPLWR